MNQNYLLTYKFETRYGNMVKTYEWFETEEDMDDFIDCELGEMSNVIEKLEIVSAREIE